MGVKLLNNEYGEEQQAGVVSPPALEHGRQIPAASFLFKPLLQSFNRKKLCKYSLLPPGEFIKAISADVRRMSLINR
jgi:hypothetical protein